MNCKNPISISGPKLGATVGGYIRSFRIDIMQSSGREYFRIFPSGKRSSMEPKVITSKDLPCRVTAGACMKIEFSPQALEGVQFIGRRLPHGWEIQPLAAGELRITPAAVPSTSKPSMPLPVPSTPSAPVPVSAPAPAPVPSPPEAIPPLMLPADAESRKHALLRQLARIQQMLNEIED